MKRKLFTTLFLMVLFAFTVNAQTTTLYLTMSGGSYPSERWVNITTEVDGAGTVIFAQGDGTYGNGSGNLTDATFVVDDGTTYYINCYDAYDDSWNGGIYEIRSEAAGGGILVANNGGNTPDDGNDEDATSAWEDMDIERESSEAFSYVPPLGDDATIFAITDPVSGFPGGQTIEIFVDLMNVGTNSFTACDINYDVYNVTTATYLVQDAVYSWTGDLASGLFENVNIGAFTSEYTTDYQITVTSVLVGDENAGNDENVADVSSETIYTLPYTEDYTAGYPPVFWTELEGLIADPTVFTPDDYNSAWYQDDYLNAVDGSTCARLNIYGTSRDEWMFSPLIDIGSSASILSFDLALTDYGNSDPPEAVGDDDKFAVIISTDYGATWSSANVLQMWDNGSTPLAGISVTGESRMIDLSAYSGVIQLGFYGESTVGSNGDNDLFVDNITIEEGSFYTVTFTVDDGTNPIEGANVNVDGTNLTTDASGIATISLGNSDYPYTVTAAGYEEYTGSVTVADANADVAVSMIALPTYTVTFTVDDGTNAIEAANVNVNGTDLTTDASGVATIDLVNGDYSYTVTATGYNEYTGSVTVADANADVAVSMTEISYTITFTVDDGTNAIEAANVNVNGTDLTTDASGVATIDLVNGDYPYTVTATGYDEYTGSVTVTDANADVAVSMTATAPTYAVTWNVSMADSIASGYFVEGTDQLWVGGSMNGWTMPGDDAAFEMTESATDDIYTVTVSLADADYEYKYFKIVGGTSSWDNGEWDGGSNRAFSVAGADVTLDDIFGYVVGVEELSAKGISVYPNPSNGLFTVNVENNFNLEVFDITGKMISAKTLTGNSTLEINNKGVYFLRFSNENGSVTQRVIVQ